MDVERRNWALIRHKYHQHAVHIEDGMMLKIGHKGTSEKGIPENTRASISYAIRAGVDGVEFDLRRTKDGVAVVIHDDTVDNTTNGTGRVRNMDLAQLKRLEIKNSGEKIPTLDEILKVIGNRLSFAFIEIKDKGLEKQTLDAVYRNGMRDNAVIISFSKQILRNVRALDKEIKLGLDHKGPRNAISFAVEVGASYLISKAQNITAKFVEQAKSNGLAVVAWTVNDVKEVERLRGAGVQGIISDYTNLW